MPSRFVFERAIRGSELPPPARHVALTIATWADVATGEIPDRMTPSLTTLHEATGLDRSTIRRHLNNLEEAGWLLRRRPSVGAARAHKARTRYVLRVPADTERALPPEDSRGETAGVEEDSGLGAQNPIARGTQPLETSELGAHSPQARGTEPLELGAENPIARGTQPLKSSLSSFEFQGGTSASRGRRSAPVAASDVVGEWIKGCAKRPPKAVVDQVARQVKQMLGEGLDAGDVSRGLEVWQSKGLNPSTLPSVVHEAQNASAATSNVLPLRPTQGQHQPFRNPTEPTAYTEEW